jgi:hypothetical protein
MRIFGVSEKTIMKKSVVWVVLLAGVITTMNSCKDDPAPIPAIVGTWSRTEYEFTKLPSGFSYWEGVTQSSFGETGYTFVFKADGKYSRSFTPVLNDQGDWTQDGTKLTVKPDDPDDLDKIEDIGIVGTEFNVVGEITDIRMELSNVVTLYLASNAAIDAAGGNTDNVPDSEWKPVDVTLIYKFNKLN